MITTSHETDADDPYAYLRAPAGPDAARLVAEQHVAAGRHTHLVGGGETRCLSGRGCLPAMLPTGA